MTLVMLLIVTFAAIVVGTHLIYTSQRVASEHQCGRCGYSLRGLPTAERCPECGVELDGSTTIVPGDFTTRRWRMIVGFLILVPAVPMFLIGVIAFLIYYVA